LGSSAVRVRALKEAHRRVKECPIVF
jgi:hypothetical protein